MKTGILTLLVLLLASPLFSQTTFKLGFEGTYPNYYNLSTYQTDWSFYGSLNANFWQGWYVGDTASVVIGNLNSNNMEGFFQPDTLIWAALGRVQINNAASTSGRFIYLYHNCGTSCPDTTRFGYGQTVMYYDKNGACTGIPGIILSQVNENGFQSLSGISDPMKQIYFPNNENGYNAYINNYYVKPRMRIDFV